MVDITNNQITQIREHLCSGCGENVQLIYPINNTGYSAEKLCPQLPICLKSKENTKVFDKYCSGDYNECIWGVKLQ